MHYHIEIHDGTNHVADRIEKITVQEMCAYTVLRPIFKNGQRYEAGSVIQLESKTGSRFVESGDIQETTDGKDSDCCD